MSNHNQTSLQLLAIFILFLYFLQPAFAHTKNKTSDGSKTSSSGGGGGGGGGSAGRSGDVQVGVSLKGSFSQVIAFGDSYTDTGNCMFMNGIRRFFGGIVANSPYGSIFKSPKNGNRFCDGRLVVDFLCEALGLPHLPPYKDPKVNVTTGVNFAVSGSTSLTSDLFSKYKIGQGFLWKSMVSQNFLTQLDWFDEFIQKMAASAGGGGTGSHRGSGQIGGGGSGGFGGGDGAGAGGFGGGAGGGGGSGGFGGGGGGGDGAGGNGGGIIGGGSGSGQAGGGASGNGGASGGIGGSGGGQIGGKGQGGGSTSGSGQVGGSGSGQAGGSASGRGQIGGSGGGQAGGGASGIGQIGGSGGGQAGGSSTGNGQIGGGGSASGSGQVGGGGSASGGGQIGNGGSASGGGQIGNGGSASGSGQADGSASGSGQVGGGGSASGSGQAGGSASGSGQVGGKGSASGSGQAGGSASGSGLIGGGGSASGSGQAGGSAAGSGQAAIDFTKVLVWIGEMGVNDYARIITSSALTGNWFSQISVDHVAKILKGVLDKGAKYLVVQGLPPVGCLPVALSHVPNSDRDEHGCSATINNLIKNHNQLLQKKIAELQGEHKDCVISYADYYGAYITIMTNVTVYQVQEPLKACCGASSGPFNFSPKQLCGAGSTGKCSDPSKYIVWDGLHLTEAMHKHLAELFFDKGYCHPSITDMIAKRSK